ncbi:hypothetical protein C8J38_10413 [Rhizobium sp. PP-WC-2G-219]|nr:hypothetical protein C8J38_10413 [Rhizobium sp. PP-WC-2G-219]
MLIDVLLARVNQTNSGIVAQIAGEAIGAATFLPDMGTEAFLSCLSGGALEGSCKDTPVLPRARVRDTRAALVEHFGEAPFVHPSALFAPEAEALAEWMTRNRASEDGEVDVDGLPDDPAEFEGDDAAGDEGADDAGIVTDDEQDGTAASDVAEAFREAAE